MSPIFASGDLDEHKITQLQAAGACIDGYGLGTQLVTGAPVNGVYKLVEIDGIPVMKEATGKVSYPGRKQIFRSYEQGTGGGRSPRADGREPAVSGQQSAGQQNLHPIPSLENNRSCS
jgi:nicotinate phosphoribosyltransferase